MGVKNILLDNKKFLLLVLALFVVSLLIIYFLNSGKYNQSLDNSLLNRETYTKPGQFMQDGVDYRILINTESGNRIEIDLFESKAPENVNSMLFLISKRYYEGLTFHKVVKDFVIQTGDTQGNGLGNPGYSVSMENTDEYFEDYSVGMANGSQFFIVLPNSDKSKFNGQYSLVGRVVSGFATVNSLAKVEVDNNYKPVNDIVIESIQILE